MLFKLMKIFFWVYPIMFFIDGSLSLLDDLWSYYTPAHSLTTLREGFAFLVLLLAIGYIYCLIYFKSKPRHWLLPIYHCVFVVMTGINTLILVNKTSLFHLIALNISPHYIFNKQPNFFILQVLYSALQTTLGMWLARSAWAEREKLSPGDLKFFKAFFASSVFSASYFLFNILIIPLVIILAAQGFLGIDAKNIQSIEKIYTKGNKRVHLIPMVHIGTEEFYQDVAKFDGSGKTLVLLEGVKDQKKLMSHMSYNKTAESLGLESQEEHFHPDKLAHQKDVTFIVADVDVSEFNQSTRDFINSLTKQMDEQSFFEVFIQGTSLPIAPGDVGNIAVDIIEKRNKKVLDEFKANEKKFDVFYIPWGALHLPEIEREIKSYGYKLTNTKSRTVIPVDQVLNKLSKPK